MLPNLTVSLLLLFLSTWTCRHPLNSTPRRARTPPVLAPRTMTLSLPTMPCPPTPVCWVTTTWILGLTWKRHCGRQQLQCESSVSKGITWRSLLWETTMLHEKWYLDCLLWHCAQQQYLKPWHYRTPVIWNGCLLSGLVFYSKRTLFCLGLYREDRQWSSCTQTHPILSLNVIQTGLLNQKNMF